MSVFDFIIRFQADGVDQLANTVAGKMRGVAMRVGAAAAGYVSLDAIKAQVESTVKYALSIKDLSEQTGISTNKLQEWQYAASMAGMSVQELIMPFNRLKLAREAALAGKPGNQDAADFSALGISTSQLKSMSPEETFNSVGQALAKVSDSADTARLAVNLFGREGIKFTNALKNGFLDAAENAQTLGIIIGEELIEKMDAAEKKMALFNNRLRRGTADAIGGGLGIWDAFKEIQGGVTQAGWEAWYNFKKGSIAGDKDKGGKILALGKTSIGDAYGEGVANEENARFNLEHGLAVASKRRSKNKTIIGANNTSPDSNLGSVVGIQNQVDSLARIGLFRGGETQSTKISQQQLKQLIKAVEKLSSIDKSLTGED